MPVNQATKKLIEKLNKLCVKQVWEMTPTEVRETTLLGKPLWGKPEPVANIEDKTIPGPNGEISIRIYTPNDTEPLPALIYFPGSGFVFGSVEIQDVLCRAIANKTQCKVISVAYHSAPEYKYPIGLHDAFAATKWVIDNATELGINKDKIAVSGYSSGGNFVALTAIWARDHNIKLRYQILICPVLDLACSAASHKKFKDGYILDAESLAWHYDSYLPKNVDRKDPKISPFWENNLHDLPEALVITAEYDPLVDEAKIYAEKLKNAGVKVHYSCYLGQIHGMLQCRGELQEEKDPTEEIAAKLKAAFKK